MVSKARHAVLIFAALVLAAWSSAQQPTATTPQAAGKDTRAPSKAAFIRHVTQEAQLVIQALQREPPNRNAARASAIIIALAAHQRIGVKGADSQQLAALRAQAVKLAEAEDTNEARKVAMGLSVETKTVADPAVVPPGLQKYFELASLHNLLATPRRGGLGIEQDLQAFARSRKPLTTAQRAKLALHANRTAVVGITTETICQDLVAQKNLPKGLAAWAREMRAAAQDLATFALAKSEDEVRDELLKLNTSCTVCHQFFRGGPLPAPPIRKR